MNVRRRLLLPLAAAALGVAAYLNALQATFLFDDVVSIVGNRHIRHIFPVVLTDRFVTDLTFKINYALGGLNPTDFHAVNVLIHILAGLTLFGTARRILCLPSMQERRLGSPDWIAFAIAALWIVHPLTTESVTYACQRYEALMGLFLLLTLYAFLRSIDSKRPGVWLLASVLACLVGMGSKSVMIAAPFVVLCLDHTLVAESWRELWRKRRWYYAGLVGSQVFLLLLVARMMRGAAGVGMETVFSLPPARYLFTQFGVILHYLRLSVWPHRLCIDYAWPVAENAASIAATGAGVLLAGVIVVWGLFRRRPWAFPGAFFFLVLGPSSSIMPVADLAAERRMYLPLAAVLALLVSLYVKLTRRASRVCHACVLGILLMLLVALTVLRNADYGTPERMWRNVIAQRPDNYRQHVALVDALTDEGRFAEAETLARKVAARTSQRLEQGTPKYVVSASNAQRYLGVARADLGRVLLCLGRLEEAVAELKAALALQPRSRYAGYNLALAYYLDDHAEAALGICRSVIADHPRYGMAYTLAGKILAERGEYAEAASMLGSGITWSGRGIVPRLELAWILAACPDAAVRDSYRALELASGLCEDTGWKSVGALDAYGAALASAGRFEEAAKAIGRAQSLLDERSGAGGGPGSRETSSRDLEQRLELYRQRKPYWLGDGH